ncbi:hypothetical protein [Moorena sp. SIO3I6]|uniref:hypothetical protein n=1 Tax=Moorena sp. SIO3I6 TaxID=2607831 RepID=UPI0013F95339|nr:hypothetical protein [Moorena sp. SIO3I6]NEP27792.1 hypothetical protein [Moorena sp. SIO3I6]
MKRFLDGWGFERGMGYHLVQPPSIVLVRSLSQIMEMSIIESLRIKFEALVPYMNEKLRRLWAASEAVALGEDGIELVVFATGIGAKTVKEGIKELQEPLSSVAIVAPSTRLRKPGGGRKSYDTIFDNFDQVRQFLTEQGFQLQGV